MITALISAALDKTLDRLLPNREPDCYPCAPIWCGADSK